MFWEACKDFYCIQLDSPLAENKSKNSFFLTPFGALLKNRRPDLKVCGERWWLPISKMVWHFTICSVVWMLELSKVGCEDLASSENKSFFLKPHFGTLSKIGSQIWKYVVKGHGFPFIKWCDTWQSVQRFGCYSSPKWVVKILQVFWRGEQEQEDTSVLVHW